MIGDNVRRVRRNMNLSQRELAEKAGISRCAINRIENGLVYEIKYKTACNIARALGVPIDSLFCD